MGMLYVGFLASGFVHGGGGVFEGKPRNTFFEAWQDAQRLAERGYSDSIAGVYPATPMQIENCPLEQAVELAGGLSMRAINTIANAMGQDWKSRTLTDLLQKKERDLKPYSSVVMRQITAWLTELGLPPLAS